MSEPPDIVSAKRIADHALEASSEEFPGNATFSNRMSTVVERTMARHIIDLIAWGAVIEEESKAIELWAIKVRSRARMRWMKDAHQYIKTTSAMSRIIIDQFDEIKALRAEVAKLKEGAP